MIAHKSILMAITLALATPFTVATFAAEDSSATAPTAAHEFTKEQAIEKALKAHPGKVTKAYQDTKKGQQTWEVKIKGDDGQKWEMYYDMKTGELVAEEAD
ncbi:MAG: hypothetical protein EKK71_09045 [Candidatus Competibacteraceae bacterium]|nr:MAG: hypothetical protein EKK71_09045 [Candidatus Competibacteraceae bacterium]